MRSVGVVVAGRGIVLALLFFLLPLSCGFGAGLDETRWFDCATPKSCILRARILEDRFRSSASRVGKVEIYRAGAILSRLLAMYIRGREDVPSFLELNDIYTKEISDDLAMLVKAMLELVLGRGVKAGEILKGVTCTARCDISKQVISSLVEIERGDLSYVSSHLKDSPDPISLVYARHLLDRGGCRESSKIFQRLLKRSGGDVDVVADWARSLLDCGKPKRNMHSMLYKALGAEPASLYLRSQLVRFLVDEGRLDEAAKVIGGADVPSTPGRGGSLFMTEVAAYNVRLGKREEAISLLRQALSAWHENVRALRLLGRIYLVERSDWELGAAYLRAYTDLAIYATDRPRLLLLLEELGDPR